MKKLYKDKAKLRQKEREGGTERVREKKRTMPLFHPHPQGIEETNLVP